MQDVGSHEKEANRVGHHVDKKIDWMDLPSQSNLEKASTTYRRYRGPPARLGEGRAFLEVLQWPNLGGHHIHFRLKAVKVARQCKVYEKLT